MLRNTHFFRKHLFAFMILLAGSTCGVAQPLRPSLSRKEKEAITDKASATVKKYAEFLNLISDPQSTGDDLEAIIDDHFASDGGNNIFFGDEWQMDDDRDISTAPIDAPRTDAKPYFQQFRNNYIQKGPNSIGCKITEVSPVYKGEERYFLRIFFTQSMNGTDDSKKPFPKPMLKVMYLQILKKGNEYVALINNIGFAVKALPITAPVVATSDEGSNNTSSRQFSQAYYDRRLAEGKRHFEDGSYEEAYVSLKDAKGSGATETAATKLIEDIFDRLRKKNVDPTKVLFDYLSSYAEVLSEQYRYAESRKYYEYAKDIRPAARAPIASLDRIAENEKRLQLLEDLLTKGARQQAIEAYQDAIKKEPKNPRVYIGLARACEALGKNSKAESIFMEALRIDPRFADIYRHQAAFYKRQLDYDKAYEALIHYQHIAEDPGEAALLSDISYCKGMTLRLKQPPAALESFKDAIAYNENNIEAIIAAAEQLARQRDLKAARSLINKVIKAGNPPAEAYYVLGFIYEKDTRTGDAIEQYQQAVRMRGDNLRWQYELGDLLMRQEQHKEAIQCFNQCIGNEISVISRSEVYKLSRNKEEALWKRAKCHDLLNENLEAENDFKKYFAKSSFITDESHVAYANFLIRNGQYPEARKEATMVRSESPAVLLTRSILAYLQSMPFEGLLEQALDSGLQKEDIINAPKLREMSKDSRKVRELLLNRRQIRL